MWSAVLFFSFISAVSAAPVYNFLPHYGNRMPSGLTNQAVNDIFSPSQLQAGMTGPISVEILLPPGFQGTATGGQGSGPGTNNMFPGVNAPISIELIHPGFPGTATGGQGAGTGTNNMFPGVNAPISIELIHPGFPGTATGGQGAGTGFIKYSLPKAPGRKSVELYYPYDFTQGQMLPHLRNIFPISYSPQTVPQQQPPRQAAPTQGNEQSLFFNHLPQTAPQQPPRTAAPQANNPQQQIQQDRQVPAGQP